MMINRLMLLAMAKHVELIKPKVLYLRCFSTVYLHKS